MPKRRRNQDPCWVCGHQAIQHSHDEGVSTNNEGQTDLGHCRVQLCPCKGWQGDAPGSSGDILEGPA